MAFTSIVSSTIAVGKAIKKELWDIVKGNFDDHESRLNLVETNATKVNVFKFDFRNAASFSALTGAYYFEADQDFTITDGYIRIFETGSLTGDLEIDVKKSTTDLDGASFTTIFTTKPSVDFDTAADYSASTNQVFDPGQVSIQAGDFLRVDITAMPTGGVLGKFLFTVYGE